MKLPTFIVSIVSLFFLWTPEASASESKEVLVLVDGSGSAQPFEKLINRAFAAVIVPDGAVYKLQRWGSDVYEKYTTWQWPERVAITPLRTHGGTELGKTLQTVLERERKSGKECISIIIVVHGLTADRDTLEKILRQTHYTEFIKILVTSTHLHDEVKAVIRQYNQLQSPAAPYYQERAEYLSIISLRKAMVAAKKHDCTIMMAENE